MHIGNRKVFDLIRVFGFAAGALASAAFMTGHAAADENWPERPVTFIVPFAPGGTTDVLTRVLADELSTELGQQFVVENRPGASGTIAGDYVAQTAPDGYTFLMGTTGVNVTTRIFMTEVPYVTEEDFESVVLVASIANALTVHPSVPVTDVQEFIAYVQERPGELFYGSAGAGGRLATEFFLLQAGIEAEEVPYQGSAPALQDLLSGDIQFVMDLAPTIAPYHESGELRVLAVSTAERSDVVPDVPTLAEAGVEGYEFTSWQALFAPAGTPEEIVTRLAEAVDNVLAREPARSRFLDVGSTPGGGTPEAFHAFLLEDVDRLTTAAERIGIEPQ